MNSLVPAGARGRRFFRFGPCLVAVLAAVSSAAAQTPAFPGALGFGANVTGGRGGTVYHVTTLADSGAGSFRDAVSHSGRIIVFDVGGYIKLNSAVSCAGNLTIAGQTAPGGGIGFRGGEISFSSRSNVICRYLRIRPGSETASSSDDALAFANGRTMIFDHCSFEFGPWNNIDCVSSDWQTTPVTEVTFQNCLNADPTGQQFGAHTESVNSTMSWFYCVFANSHNRNPLSKINDVFVNNVLYNCSSGYTTHTSTDFKHDLVNNYFVAGPAAGGSSDFPWFQVDTNQTFYYSGNLFDNNRDGVLNGSATSPTYYQLGYATLPSTAAPWSSITANAPTYSPATAFRLAVSWAGALPRDQIDDLVASQIKTLGHGTTGTGAGTVGPDGGLYTSQAQTGLGNNGYGVINGGIAAIDTDNDGMPDYWEKAMGLNFTNASDATTTGPDGYANIERYINWLADPHAMTVTNTPVDIDLWQYTSGFTNANPAYTVTILSNGVVTLSGGHVAHFTPAANFAGMGAFQFTVVANDGSAWTNNVAVLASPVVPPSDLIWQGDGTANVWGNGNGANWLNGANLVAFNSGDNVTFDDAGSNTPAISLTGSLPATTVSVLAAQDYTFAGSGAISGGAVLFKTGSGRLTLLTTNTYAGGTTINDGVVQLGDGAAVNGSITGNVTNNDTLVYANPGLLSSSVNLAGYGQLIKNAAGALTLSGTHTFNGEATINAGSLQFSGTIPPCDISNNTTLVLAPTSFTLYTNLISGPGAVTTSASGAMILAGTNTFTGNLTNSSGFVILSNNAAAGAGTVVYNGGFVVVAAGMVITNNYSIPGSSASDLCLMATNSGTGTWAGDVVNLGSSAQFRPGSDGGTLAFWGTAALGARYLIVPRGAVQFGSNAVITTTQTGCALGRDTSGGNRSANITIRDNASVTLGACNLGGGQAGGNVTVTLQNNGVLNCGTNFDVQNINRATAITFIRLNGGTLITGGFSKTKTSQTNSIAFNGGVLKANANNGGFLPNFGAVASTNLVQSGGAVVDDGGYAISFAARLIHDPALGAAADGGLTKLGAGTLTLGVSSGFVQSTFTGPTVINAGTLVLALNTLTNSSRVFVNSGAVLDASAAASSAVVAGWLWGNGLIKGNVLLGNGAVLAPGSNAIGALTFSHALALASGSTNLFEISHAPLTNDAAMILGALTNGGTLIVTNLGDAPLAAGDTFKLFNAGSYHGNFANVQLPPLPAGLAWNTNNLNSAGVLSVGLNTTPVISSISFSGGRLGLSGTGGVGSADYVLLGATNLATPAGSWTRLLTNQFDSSGNFNFTTNANVAMPQNFYRLQLR